MGCISSKLRAEDVVGRCKARKKLMKQAVEHRHGFAAAHAAYVQSLRNTGAALRQFAEGEGGLPASGHGPFARIAEPPPPPPLLVPLTDIAALSGPPTPLNPAALAREPPPVLEEWDFLEPFDPSEPPVHLQEQRKTIVQKTGTDLNDSNVSQAESYTPMNPVISQPDDNQGTQINAFQCDKAIMETHVETSQNDIPQQLWPIAEGTHVRSSPAEGTHLKSDPTEMAPHELPDEGNVDHELGFTLKLNENKDLVGIVKELDEEFLKASTGAADVARALETRKPHFHTAVPRSKFRKYNSARVFSAFNWNWSRNPLLTKEEVESTLDELGRNASHALTLERLLAWEKKLFEEVKVVQSLCLEREKKCTRLRRQEVKGEDASEIMKTKTEIKRLCSLIMVSYQRVDATIEAIEDLRDDELHPQLVGLIDGLMSMWVTMHQCHARQTQIIIHIKSLDAMTSQEPTSEAHHQATIQLEKELHCWHESFCKLVATQRGYMAALYGWLKLSLMPIPTGKEKKRTAEEDSDEDDEELDIYRICEEWQRALGCLPDKVASEAIKSLVEVVKAMVAKQAEEMKQKRKAEKLEKQWEKKAQALQPWEEEEEEERRKRSRGRGRDVDDDDDDGRASELMPVIGLMERREAVAVMKKKVEGEMMKHGRAVQDTRVLTMNNLQTGLPGVLEAMTGFSAVCSQAFQHLHSLTRFSNTCILSQDS